MKTLLQSLLDEMDYPVKKGRVENIIIRRDLDPDAPFSFDIANTPQYRGAVADCLVALITVPNFSESDISVSLSDKDLILKRANGIYDSLGESDARVGIPKVFIGG